jgi:antitoxin component YwqK of YwqJK toxin-antitoxin module
MSIGVGLGIPVMIIGLYYILKDEWIPNLKSKFRKKYNQDPTKLEIVPDGEYSYYDEDDGSLLIKTYKHGKQHGPSYYHYNSGELWIEENYLDGKIHGTTKYYNKDGSTKKEETWKDGKYIN